MNSNVRDNGNFFLSWPVFEGRQTVPQTLTNTTLTGVLLDTNDIDTDNGHSTVTNTDRYVGKTPGRFQLSGGIAYTNNGTGTRSVEYTLNGTIINGCGVIFQSFAGADIRMAGRTFTQVLNGSTDYIQLLAWQNSGGNLTTATAFAALQSVLTIRMLGTT